MKPHFVVTLAQGEPAASHPHWTRAIAEKGAAEAPLNADIAALLRRFAVPVWTTHEYRPSGADWSAAELASGLDRIYRLILKQSRAIPEGLIDAIRLLPGVADARPGRVACQRLPSARPMALARGAGRDDAARRAISLPAARKLADGADIIVAVIDTGVDLDHPELAGALAPGADFVDILEGQTEFLGDFLGADDDPEDEVGHGTHVAGIIAARGRAMPPGVAPKVRVLPVRVLAAMRRGDQKVGAGLVENINSGIKWAIDHGADVINMSLGVRHEGGGLPHREMVDYAARRGVSIVAAAGNDGQEAFYYPGAFPSVITVGSMAPNGKVSDFSTYGPQISLIAPGEEIYSTHVDGGYAHASGTSHAAPFVAGAAALIHGLARKRGGRLGTRAIKRVLADSADRAGAQLRDRRAGFGRLNIFDALRLAEARMTT